MLLGQQVRDKKIQSVVTGIVSEWLSAYQSLFSGPMLHPPLVESEKRLESLAWFIRDQEGIGLILAMNSETKRIVKRQFKNVCIVMKMTLSLFFPHMYNFFWFFRRSSRAFVNSRT